jgi:hypothetical protein
MQTLSTTTPLQESEPIFEWTARLKMWRSSLVMGQLALVLGIPILLLGLLLIVLDWPPDIELISSVLQVMGIVAGIFLVLVTLALGLVYRGGYDYHYSINADGIRATTTGRTAKTNRIVNTLLMLSGRPSAAGAGILAAARQDEYLAWSDVSAFSVDARQHTITLKSGPLPAMLVVCEAGQFSAVLEFVRAATGKEQGTGNREQGTGERRM